MGKWVNFLITLNLFPEDIETYTEEKRQKFSKDFLKTYYINNRELMSLLFS